MPTDTTAEAQVVLLDTSLAIALVVEDHEAHEAAMGAVRGLPLGLSGHAWFETYSVLTRLPGRNRRSPADALRLLAHNFPASVFLRETDSQALGGEIARLGFSGGAAYAALVGAAARAHGLPLWSVDARARPVYEGLGVDHEFIALVPPER
ncbi:MAG TPA: PIN domain-containing protein [Candidatus Limnocylindrales bacterium]|nr:PIN domain-containing protein [Candidatus Limnocylindrales bacterium]